MMATRPNLPGMSFARQPGTTLITCRFPEPVLLAEAEPQKKTGTWTSVKGKNLDFFKACCFYNLFRKERRQKAIKACSGCQDQGGQEAVKACSGCKDQGGQEGLPCRNV